MSFKDIYNKVEELKDYSLEEIIELLGIKLIYNENMIEKALFINYDNKPTIILNSYDLPKCIILHEIGHCLFDRGHHLYKRRTDENNANTFMCLMLIKNVIWDYVYFDKYLIDNDVTPRVARQFNDRVWQYKYQVKYDFVY